MANVGSPKRNRTLGNANKPASKKQRNKRDISDEESLSSSSDANASILITPRDNEFNSRTWWMVDLYPAADSSPQGATELVKRCMTSYSWDEVKTRKVLTAYRQFLLLKKIHKDWNAEVLSPCYLVDQMWHCHILDVVNYCHDTMLLCGKVLGHNPSGALDIEAKKKRDNETRVCLLEEFGEYDKEVWDYSPHASAARAVNDRNAPNGASGDSDGRSNEEHDMPNLDRAIERTSSSYVTKSGDTVGDPEPEISKGPITFIVKDGWPDENGNREEVNFKVKRTTLMGKVLDAYACKKNVCVDELRFLFDGERVCHSDTPAILYLDDGDQIDCYPIQLGC